MKLARTKVILNIVIIAWIVLWAYYAVFNWDVFIVKLNTSLGFTVINCFPFIFFFVFGLVCLGLLKFLLNQLHMQLKLHDKDSNSKIALLEKDIEILKLKEVLFNMQTDEMNKNASSLGELQKKLDELSGQVKGIKE